MPNFSFFGSSRLSVIVLDTLFKSGNLPALIVTTPDKPRGRKLVITPNEVKVWAKEHDIPVLDPTKLNEHFLTEYAKLIKEKNISIALVASYGRILPEAILTVTKEGMINIHPSLLPKYRGPSPLPTAILDDEKNTGVTIMKVDKEMDHGAILAQEKTIITEWPTYEDFETIMAQKGAEMAVKVMQEIAAGKAKEVEQDHAHATYTRKFTKEDGLLDLTAEPYLNFRKIQAFHQWPQAYFFVEKAGKKLRVKVTDATFKEGKLIIKKVIPEGDKEMAYEAFQRNYGSLFF